MRALSFQATSVPEEEEKEAMAALWKYPEKSS
jgi:hypothetical protein